MKLPKRNTGATELHSPPPMQLSDETFQLDSNSEVGRDGALRRPRAVIGAEREPASDSCTILSDRSTRSGTAQRAVPASIVQRSTSEFALNQPTQSKTMLTANRSKSIEIRRARLRREAFGVGPSLFVRHHVWNFLDRVLSTGGAGGSPAPPIIQTRA